MVSAIVHMLLVQLLPVYIAFLSCFSLCLRFESGSIKAVTPVVKNTEEILRSVTVPRKFEEHNLTNHPLYQLAKTVVPDSRFQTFDSADTLAHWELWWVYPSVWDLGFSWPPFTWWPYLDKSYMVGPKDGPKATKFSPQAPAFTLQSVDDAFSSIQMQVMTGLKMTPMAVCVFAMQIYASRYIARGSYTDWCSLGYLQKSAEMVTHPCWNVLVVVFAVLSMATFLWVWIGMVFGASTTFNILVGGVWKSKFSWLALVLSMKKLLTPPPSMERLHLHLKTDHPHDHLGCCGSIRLTRTWKDALTLQTNETLLAKLVSAMWMAKEGFQKPLEDLVEDDSTKVQQLLTEALRESVSCSVSQSVTEALRESVSCRFWYYDELSDSEVE